MCIFKVTDDDSLKYSFLGEGCMQYPYTKDNDGDANNSDNINKDTNSSSDNLNRLI